MKFVAWYFIYKKIINVLILYGGYGSRISNITKKFPNVLIKIIKNHCLYYLIKNFRLYHFNNFYLISQILKIRIIIFQKNMKKILVAQLK